METGSFDLIHYFTQGGFFMYPILGVSIFGTIIFTERLLAYRIRFRVDGRRLFNEVKKYLQAKDFRRAVETCRQYPTSPLAQVLSAGLTNAARPIDEIDTAMEAEALYQLPQITARVNYLAGLSNLATLLGLLGTISGLIASFAAVGGVHDFQAARESELASGIAVAMTCTAFGLITAIPMLLMHQFINNQATYLVDEIQHYATNLKRVLQRLKTDGVIDAELDSKKELKDYLDADDDSDDGKVRGRKPSLSRS